MQLEIGGISGILDDLILCEVANVGDHGDNYNFVEYDDNHHGDGNLGVSSDVNYLSVQKRKKK